MLLKAGGPAGANINARDNMGYTPLLTMIKENNSCQYINDFISKGPDLNVQGIYWNSLGLI